MTAGAWAGSDGLHVAVEAFELAVADHLLEPVSQARLGSALAGVAARWPPEPVPPTGFLTEVRAPRGREIRPIAAGALDLVQAERDSVRLHAAGTAYPVRMTLSDFEDRLDPGRFLRIHRPAPARRPLLQVARPRGRGRGCHGPAADAVTARLASAPRGG